MVELLPCTKNDINCSLQVLDKTIIVVMSKEKLLYYSYFKTSQRIHLLGALLLVAVGHITNTPGYSFFPIKW